MNRATNPNDDSWKEMQSELNDRIHIGLTKIEAPTRDPHAAPPRARAFHYEKKNTP